MSSSGSPMPAIKEQYHLRFDSGVDQFEWVPVPGVNPRLEKGHAWVPFRLDFKESKLYWAPLTKEQLKKADFLDARLLQSAQPEFLRLTSLDYHGRQTQAETLWLFHFGHCGSTSLSRALGGALDIPTYREPGAMWAFFKKLEEAHALTSSEVELGRYLISTMTRDLGSALIKPSSLHMEFISHQLVEQTEAKALFLVHRWRTCLLNGLKNLKPEESLGGDYPMYEQSAWNFWQRHAIDIQAMTELKRDLPGPIGTLIIGWLGKVSMLHDAWQTLNQLDEKIIIPFEKYVAAPKVTVEQIAYRLNCQTSAIEELDIGKLGKGHKHFKAKSFAQTLSQVEATYEGALTKCEAHIKKLHESNHEVGIALRFFQNAVGVES